MKRSKTAVKYHGISLPTPLIELVKEFIQTKPEYRSVAEFARYAMIEKIQHTPGNEFFSDVMSDKEIQDSLKMEYPHYSPESREKIKWQRAKITPASQHEKESQDKSISSLTESQLKKLIQDAIEEKMRETSKKK